MKFLIFTLFLGCTNTFASNLSLPTPTKEALDNLILKYKIQNSKIIGLEPNDSNSVKISTEDYEEAKKSLDNLESICGTDDLVYLNNYTGSNYYNKNEAKSIGRSVGLIQWKYDITGKYRYPKGDSGNVAGARWCTGFLISKNLFATAGHCFDRKAKKGWLLPSVRNTEGKYNVISEKEMATNMNVHFDFLVNPLDPQKVITFPVESLEVYRPSKKDFAIVKLGKRKNLEAGDVINPLKVNPRELLRNENISIVQHPAGDAKKIGFGNINSIGSLIRYNNIDTLGGSSGSPVLDKNGSVIGVHIQGGCRNSGWGANKAIAVNSLINVFQQALKN